VFIPTLRCEWSKLLPMSLQGMRSAAGVALVTTGSQAVALLVVWRLGPTPLAVLTCVTALMRYDLSRRA
jgi:hypothetical protein